MLVIQRSAGEGLLGVANLGDTTVCSRRASRRKTAGGYCACEKYDGTSKRRKRDWLHLQSFACVFSPFSA
jgi:hypothetical protein